MRDRQPLDELSSAVSVGLMAEDTVLALSRAVRGDDLRGRDRAVLETVRAVFAKLAAAEVVLAAPARDQMLPDNAYLHAVRAIEATRPDEEVQEAAARVVSLLDVVLGEDSVDDVREQILSLRELFVSLGKTSLTQTNDLGRARQESYSWQPSQAILSS